MSLFLANALMGELSLSSLEGDALGDADGAADGASIFNRRDY